jgi:hypothetical protein
MEPTEVNSRVLGRMAHRPRVYEAHGTQPVRAEREHCGGRASALSITILRRSGGQSAVHIHPPWTTALEFHQPPELGRGSRLPAVTQNGATKPAARA